MSAAAPTSDARPAWPRRFRVPGPGGCAGSWPARSGLPGAVSDDRAQGNADRADEPGAALRLRALESAAGVPHQMADAGAEVVAEADDESEGDEVHERQRQQARRAR